MSFYTYKYVPFCKHHFQIVAVCTVKMTIFTWFWPENGRKSMKMGHFRENRVFWSNPKIIGRVLRSWISGKNGKSSLIRQKISLSAPVLMKFSMIFDKNRWFWQISYIFMDSWISFLRSWKQHFVMCTYIMCDFQILKSILCMKCS